MMDNANFFIDDRNYEVIHDAYTLLDTDFDEEKAPAKVIALIYEAKNLLDDALRIYEDGDDETDDIA